MRISRTGLSSLKDDLEKYEDKVPDVSDSNQNVETTCNSKLKLTGLKDTFITVYMYIANITFLRLQIFSGRYHFSLSSCCHL